MVLRYCLLGYGIGGAIGLLIASAYNPLLGVLIAWLGGGALSVGWIYLAYRRQCAVRSAASGRAVPSMQEALEPSH
jgi:hypothetical protein